MRALWWCVTWALLVGSVASLVVGFVYEQAGLMFAAAFAMYGVSLTLKHLARYYP